MSSFIEAMKNNIDENSRKKIIKFAMLITTIVVILIIIIVIFSIINRKISYEKMEEIMENAAYDYFQNNINQLPTPEIKTSVVSVQTLIDQEYMKEIYKYTKDESCTGNVIVTNYNGEYDYQGYLMCNDFTTSLLVDEIKKNNEIKTSGAGLYDELGTLRFRGEYVNNYLEINDNIYRIIKIDSENKIYITPNTMDDNNDTLRVYWDDRYNSEEETSCGINDYSISRINDSLNNVYNELDKDLKENIVNYDLCINKRSDIYSVNDGSIECAQKMENQKIGLLPIYEYIKASIAPSCLNAQSKECKNYNYLVMEDLSWWTMTGDSSNTYNIYYITLSGEIDKDKGNNRKMARYVVALKPNVLLKDGNGTESNPYKIR